MRAFVQALPKAELHSHLAGSIRDSTLRELIPADSPLHATLETTKNRSLSDSFQIFAVIHSTITTSALLSRIVGEMIEDNARDNVVYLEMRTTPRRLQDCPFAEGESSTRRLSPRPGLAIDIAEEEEAVDFALNHYLESVAHAVAAKVAVFPQIQVRLIVSVNRTSPLENIKRIISLALAYQKNDNSRLVVGLDISGDPTRGNLAPILELLAARVKGRMPVSIHAGECMNVSEMEAVLDYAPERLGHCCVLAEASRNRMVASRIPLELCPTSNMLTLHLPRFSYHPQAAFLFERDFPVAICTDDSGVFNVSLTDELVLVAETGGFSLEAASKLVTRAFDYLFCDDALRDQLKQHALQVAAQELLRHSAASSTTEGSSRPVLLMRQVSK